MSQRKTLTFGIKAQATTELAIFGTILLGVLGYLLTYGLRSNYEQNLQMKTFRQALAKAYDENATSFSANVVVVEDKTSPDLSDAFGLGSRTPLQASGSAVCSNKLMTTYSGGTVYNNKNPWFLPKLTLRVNEQEYTFTLAGYEEYSIEGETVRKKKSDYKDEKKMDGTPGSDNIYWYWEEVAHTDAAIEENKTYDVNGDGKEETVLSRTLGKCLDCVYTPYPGGGGDDDTDYDPEECTCARCTCVSREVISVGVVSEQAGEIDPTQNTKDIREGKQHGGLQSYRYDKIEERGKDGKPISLRKQESRQEITTTTTHNTRDVISRYILLNKVTQYADDTDYKNIIQQLRQRGDGYEGYEDDEIYVGDKDGRKIDDIGAGDEFDSRGFPEGEYLWLKIVDTNYEDNTTRIWKTPK